MDIKSLSDKLKANIGKVIIGKDDVIEKIIIAALCSGHVLLEDIPGTGKTTAAKALAWSVSCDFKRVQFTPDLLPSDVTGLNIYDRKENEFRFRPGAVFTNILLADEINRATPRTQSGLLECMEERQATIDGKIYPLKAPFMVIATQNPIETQGTFPLPEAQLDRFLMRLSMGYPSRENELSVMDEHAAKSPIDSLEAVASAEELVETQKYIGTIKVSQAVKEYILDICTETRTNQSIRLGVSPRGTLALLKAAKAQAAVSGRDFVTPDDVKKIAPDVIAHRIIPKTSAVLREGAAAAQRDLAVKAIESVRVPIE